MVSQSTAAGAAPELGESAASAALSAAAVSCVYFPSAEICESALAAFHDVWIASRRHAEILRIRTNALVPVRHLNNL